MAAFLVRTAAVGYYAPMLLVIGLVTGFLIGVSAGELLRRLPKA